jgi:hypothetical protein
MKLFKPGGFARRDIIEDPFSRKSSESEKKLSKVSRTDSTPFIISERYGLTLDFVARGIPDLN